MLPVGFDFVNFKSAMGAKPSLEQRINQLSVRYNSTTLQKPITVWSGNPVRNGPTMYADVLGYSNVFKSMFGQSDGQTGFAAVINALYSATDDPSKNTLSFLPSKQDFQVTIGLKDSENGTYLATESIDFNFQPDKSFPLSVGYTTKTVVATTTQTLTKTQALTQWSEYKGGVVITQDSAQNAFASLVFNFGNTAYANMARSACNNSRNFGPCVQETMGRYFDKTMASAAPISEQVSQTLSSEILSFLTNTIGYVYFVISKQSPMTRINDQLRNRFESEMTRMQQEEKHVFVSINIHIS